MNLLELSSLVHDKNSAIIFLQAHGILHEQRHCSNGHLMTLSVVSDRWRCNIRGCRKEISIRKDTWLQDSKLDFRKIVLFIYCWTKKFTTIDFLWRRTWNFIYNINSNWISANFSFSTVAGVFLLEGAFYKRSDWLTILYPFTVETRSFVLSSAHPIWLQA